VFSFNGSQRSIAKRSKGATFDKQLCVSIVAFSDLLEAVFNNYFTFW
jgi:hypothetical protein